ncbi:hypothetical protein [Methylomagnum ishizawai]|nr:hypothetical protein [Methylomagnum ishizawai]
MTQETHSASFDHASPQAQARAWVRPAPAQRLPGGAARTGGSDLA